MSIRFKIFLAFFLLFLIGIFQITRIFRDDVRKSYLESLEENMVDSANILAEIAGEHYSDGRFDLSFLKSSMRRASERNPKAKIYRLLKNKIDADIYIADKQGKILFNSRKPEKVGKFYGNWNDVAKCLQGNYGARSTRLDKDDPSSSILYVAAPITSDGKTVGVLTYIKPIKFTTFFINQRKARLVKNAVFICLAAFVVFLIFSEWAAAPVLRLTEYVKALSSGKTPEYPRIGHGEVAELGKAFEEMRTKLDGKKYVEDYVRTLTHELKSPISAIRGATELLDDDGIPSADRVRFLEIIKRENSRMAEQVDRMLQLSRLEGHDACNKFEMLDINQIIDDIVDRYRKNILGARKITCRLADNIPEIKGEQVLLKEAVANLLRNAVDFTEENGTIEIKTFKADGKVVIELADNGTGIPEYARERVFEKFYSLARPDSGQKSSGLGLSIVRRIAHLHNGEITLTPNQPCGVKAVLELPVA